MQPLRGLPVVELSCVSTVVTPISPAEENEISSNSDKYAYSNMKFKTITC